jgi:DNA replication protein DnaC
VTIYSGGPLRAPRSLSPIPLRTEIGRRTGAGTFYDRLLDARTGRRSAALAANIDFGAWADSLGDPPLATAFFDRLVDGAVILKLTGRSYRARRAPLLPETGKADRA